MPLFNSKKVLRQEDAATALDTVSLFRSNVAFWLEAEEILLLSMFIELLLR
jgi:hypothetical protein